MFFTLSWVFYHNDNLINGDFLGYFTFIGEVWLYKVLISVVPFICGLILFWYLFYMLHIHQLFVFSRGYITHKLNHFAKALFHPQMKSRIFS